MSEPTLAVVESLSRLNRQRRFNKNQKKRGNGYEYD